MINNPESPPPPKGRKYLFDQEAKQYSTKAVSIITMQNIM